MKFDQEKLKVTGVPPKPEEWSGTSGIRDPGVGSWSCIACPYRFLSLVIAYGPKPLWLIPDDLFCNTMQSQTTYQHPEVPQKVHSHVPPEMRSLLENYPHFTFASVGLELDNPPVLGSSFAFVCEPGRNTRNCLWKWREAWTDGRKLMLIPVGTVVILSLTGTFVACFHTEFLDKDSSETIGPCRPPALSHWTFPTGDLPKL